MRAPYVRLPLYAAGLATGGAFGVLFTGGATGYLIGAALLAMVVGSSGAYRFVLLFPATALYTLLAVYGAPPLSLGGWRRLLEGAGYDVWQAAGIMYANPVPYDTHPGLLVVLIPVVVVVVAFATSATLYEESPVVSVSVLGLTIGVLGTVSFETGIGPYFFLFLPAAIALLLLTADGRPSARPSIPPSAGVAGAVVACGVLLLPTVPGAREAIRPALVDWTTIGMGGTSRLAVEADVGDYLTAGRDAELLRIRSPEALMWRGGTLDRFDGARWSSTVEPGEDYGEEIFAGVPTRNVVQSVEVLDAQTDLLFGGYRMKSVSSPSAQERSDASWSSPLPLGRGSSYRVLSQVPQPTASQLEAAGVDYPAPVREKFLQLPEGRPEVLRETAEAIERDYDPATPYAAARAVERYLIYDGGFTYNLSVDYNRADRALEEFLGEGREGFCTQFATSMALMLREMGIPSRVVYGAVTGEEVEPNEYVVTGDDMHTWVEAYFPGVGWYPFDPTPGFDVPTAMEVNAPRPALPAAADGLTPENRALQGEQRPESPSEPEQPTSVRGANAVDETGAWTWAAYAIPLVLLVAAVPLLKRALAARGRTEDLYRDLVGRLRDALPPGKASLADSPALTPTEKLVLLAGAAGVEEGPFREVANAFSESLYASRGLGAATRVGDREAARAYRRALEAYERLPRWRRALAALNPAFLLLRGRRNAGARLVKALRGRFGSWA